MAITAPLDIINSALVKLGAMPVIDVNDGATKESQLMGVQYETALGYVLGEHGWKCAIKRVNLAPTAIQPLQDLNTLRHFQYAYQLPSDFVRPVLNDDSELKFQIEGNQILTNLPGPLLCRYVWLVNTPEILTRDLKETISYYLAQDVSLSITQNSQFADRLTKQYNTFLSRAKFKDASTSKALVQQEDFLTMTRLAGNQL